MTRYIVPVNVLETLGVSKEQYAHMTQGEVIELIKLCYQMQLNSQSDLNKK